MSRKVRPHLFYDTTRSVCDTCLRPVDARIVLQDGRVFMDKWCLAHGSRRVLLADDDAYYRACREIYVKAPEMPATFGTPMRWGCPYDCGLCTDHQQHSCLAIVEITDSCNLDCPVCYAASGTKNQTHKPLATCIAMLDAVVAAEGEADIVQISGGEPTLHPEFFAILDAARARPIRHLMVNTNGIRIATDPAFAERLASYMPGIEVYLQFDSLRDDATVQLRGARLDRIRRAALDRLDALGLSTTLVMTLKRGLNDHEIGDVIRFALTRPSVRGVTLQPIQDAGRVEDYDERRHRLTVSEIRRRVAEQSGIFTLDDLLPVPCNPDTLGMAYALRIGDEAIPLTRYVDTATLLEGTSSTIAFERDPRLKESLFRLLSTGHSPEAQANCLADLLCCLPRVQVPEALDYRNVFRVLIVQFMDAHSLDMRAVKRSCVHFAQPDGRMIPFETFNLFYRGANADRVATIRAEIDRDRAARLEANPS